MAINDEVHDNVILVFVLRHLMEHNFTETAHCLERESGFYFHIPYFEELIMTDRYDEAEDYALGFTSVQENIYSAKLIFDIKKLSGARHYARDIVNHEFPQFTPYNNRIYDQAMELVCMENYRNHQVMRRYALPGTRRLVVEELKKCIRENPAFQGKLKLPLSPTMVQRLIAERQVNGGASGGFFPVFRDYWNGHGNN